MRPATIYTMWPVPFAKIMTNLQSTETFPRLIWEIYLFIHDAGAHGFSMGYNYNGRLRSAEILLQEDGTAKLIRRAETPKDYFATFDCFDFYKNLKFEK